MVHNLLGDIYEKSLTNGYIMCLQNIFRNIFRESNKNVDVFSRNISDTTMFQTRIWHLSVRQEFVFIHLDLPAAKISDSLKYKDSRSG